ncbi:MFS general substrate transporter [Trametopsis cervina]|nr:MFS general substrate transporter [Trametopsis cervina]
MTVTGKAHLRNALISVAIAANALCAGGVFSFPLIAPALSDQLRLSQPQITTIALAGMVGQYPFAAVVGKVLDAYGPRVCSFIAGVLFSSGFALFSRELSSAADTSDTSSDVWVLRRLVLYFGMIGLGTVFSYFSTVFSATRTFPNYNGVASGTSMALFGSSPLFLTMIATRKFSDEAEKLDAARFLAFAAVLTAVTHLFGSFALRVPSATPDISAEEPTIIVNDEENDVSTPDRTPLEDEDADENSAMLSFNKHSATAVEIIPVQEPQHGSVLDLLRDGHFWILALVGVVVVGSCEMVMANLASIFLSLPSGSETTANTTIATQVQLIATANTLSRLLVGPLSDFLSPVASYVRSSGARRAVASELDSPSAEYVYSFPRKQIISRVFFLAIFNALLLATFSFVEGFARTRESLWVLSIGVGFAYGGTFTIIPGLLTSIWGAPNLGRNFGVISYAPFVGTSIYAYLYAFMAERHNQDTQGTCKGAGCWQSTFAVCIVTLSVTLAGSLILWRRWRGRV